MRAGMGISAQVEGRCVLCGSEKFLAESGVTLGEAAQACLDRLRAQGKASVLVAG